MSVLSMRDAIVSRIRATIPALRTCEPHGGDFTTTELDRYTTNTPAALVVCLGMSGSEDLGGETLRTYRWAVFVVARDLPRGAPETPIAKADVALSISDTLARLVSGERWNGTAGTAASSIRTQNLYSAASDRRGVTFWAVTWEQATDDEDELLDVSTLPDFLRIHTDYDLAPGDEHLDAQDTTQVRP